MQNSADQTLVRAMILCAADPAAPARQETEAGNEDARELAHDIKNVFQLLSGSLELIARDVAGLKGAERRICNARTGLDHGIRLTNSVLDRCRAAGRITSTEEVVDQHRLSEMTSLLRDAVGAGVTLETEIPENLWLMRLDFVRLQNALLNLALNARDAMCGRGNIRLSARNTAASNGSCDKVVISLADSGAGIPADLIDKIFAPFFTTKATGSGLGLAIVREFSRASNADIAVESGAGVGTVFHLAFPRWCA